VRRLLALSVPLCLVSAGCGEDPEAPAEIAKTSEVGSEFAIEANTVTTEPAASFGVDRRPVRIGFDGPDLDACGAYGEITGLNPDGDNFLSVRTAPNAEAEETDRLTSGTGVSLCETETGWIGIVYQGAGLTGGDCGTGSPVDDVREYDGPCRSGWVSQRYVELIAG